MLVKIKETDQVQELKIVDPETNVEYTQDEIGNTGDLNGCDHDGEYHVMSNDMYDWWNSFLAKKQESENMIHEYGRDNLVDDEEYQNILGCEYESQPQMIINYINSVNN